MNSSPLIAPRPCLKTPIALEAGDSHSKSMESQKALHSQYVLQLLQLQRRTGFLCDITIYVRDQAFKAHKPLLAACSLYFRSIFSDVENSQTKALNLASLTPIGFEILLDYIYSGSLAITFDNSKEVLSAATCLQMTNVVETCVNFIRSSFTKATLNSGFTNAFPPSLPSPSTKKYDQNVPTQVMHPLSSTAPPSRITAMVNSKPDSTGSKLDTGSGLSEVNPDVDLTDVSALLSPEELNKIMPFLLAKNARRPTMQEVVELIRKNFPQKFGSSGMYPLSILNNQSKIPNVVSSQQKLPNAIMVDRAITSQTTARSGAINNIATPEQTSGMTKSLASTFLESEGQKIPTTDCTLIDNNEGNSGQSQIYDSRHRIGWNASKSVQISTDLSGTPSDSISNMTSPGTLTIPTMSIDTTRNAISDSELVITQNHGATERPNSEGNLYYKYKKVDTNDRISEETANSAVAALYACQNNTTDKEKANKINQEENEDGKGESKEDRMKKFDELLDDDETTTFKIERDLDEAWMPDVETRRNTGSVSSVNSTSDDQALDLTTKYPAENKNEDRDDVSSVSSTISESPFVTLSQNESVSPASPTSLQSDQSTSANDYQDQNNLLDIAIQSAQQELNNGFPRPVTFSRKPRRTSGGQTCQWPGCGRLFRHKNIYEEHIKLHEKGVPVSQLRKCYMGARVKKTVRERLEEMRTSHADEEKDDPGKKKKAAPLPKKRRTSAPLTQGLERKRVSPKDRLEYNQFSTPGLLHGPPPSNLLMRTVSLTTSPTRVAPPSDFASASDSRQKLSQDAHNARSVVRNTSAVAETLAALGIKFRKQPRTQPDVGESSQAQVFPVNEPIMMNHLRMQIARRENSSANSTSLPMGISFSNPRTSSSPTQKHHPSATSDRGYNV